MKLMRKQLVQELLKNRIFLILLVLLTGFSSFLYFFVHFSADQNLVYLNNMAVLNDEQLLFQNGLQSNVILAGNILAGFLGMAGFAFALFFNRFFKECGIQLGCLKTVGFTDRTLMCLFLISAAVLSFGGALIGLTGGYFASDILLASARQSYLVEGIVKGINTRSILTGLLVPTAVCCLITGLSYGQIWGKETGVLLRGEMRKTADSLLFRLADRVAKCFPEKKRLSVRLALRSLTAVFLVFVSVMSVSVFFLLGYSLYGSSRKLWESQTVGHYYEYDTAWDVIRSGEIPMGSVRYLTEPGKISGNNQSVEWILAGVDCDGTVFELLDQKGARLDFPKRGEMVIGIELAELYGFQKGDQVTVNVGGKRADMLVSAVAFNAKTGWAYVSREELAAMLSRPADSYSGLLGTSQVFPDGETVTRTQKLEALDREMVSNRVSAVINEVIGCVAGCILLFLALFLNFQSSAEDIRILRLLGYRKKEIRRMLLDIYRPLVWASFFLSLLPALQITRRILRSLSIQIGDFMMFQTSFYVVCFIFIIINVLYDMVLALFDLGLKKDATDRA